MTHTSTLEADAVSDGIPQDFLDKHSQFSICEAEPQKPAEFGMEPVGATLDPEQLEAAWSGVAARHREMMERIKNPPAGETIEILPGDVVEPEPAPQPATPPSDNPKDQVGSDKLPMHLWPATATAMGSVALFNGALKYGRANWRGINVRASIYVDACQRHMAAWFEGEESDEEGVPHLASALACLAILVDAQAAGTLNDDRQYPGGFRSLVDSLTPHVARLRALHAGRTPKHWMRSE